jgi:hypothetical protein
VDLLEEQMFGDENGENYIGKKGLFKFNHDKKRTENLQKKFENTQRKRVQNIKNLEIEEETKISKEPIKVTFLIIKYNNVDIGRPQTLRRLLPEPS